ncbi:Uu.00g054130.m01.CDS01 [Anthostomella pinea]|uniref:Uu.00g054130.m01.CDS01 n=1 Tax=Anthostomella pinea TaxID=933095 RepID=A0AAI8VWL6_9PEZI|nr:Uu.00g054130.m01.CDS01 [Anthostomella pinea]
MARLVISIDFGTTFSGVAAAFTPHRVSVVQQWPATSNYNSDSVKVPSAIRYTKLGVRHVPTSWGFQVPGDSGDYDDDEQGEGTSVRWFKLLLPTDEEVPVHLRQSDHLQKARDSLVLLGKDEVTVVADFLRPLWEHALLQVAALLSQLRVETAPFHVVITVPAIYKDDACERMRKAVVKAGILEDREAGKMTVLFVSELEAAASHTLLDILKPDNLLKDIISYVITQVEPVVQFQEYVEGTGGLYGGHNVDQAFRAHMRERFKTCPTRFRAKDIRTMLNDNWEHGIKRRYYGPDFLPTVTVAGHDFHLNERQVEGFFTTVFEGISNLLKGQIESINIKRQNDKGPDHVILSVGFGRCKRLHNHLLKLKPGINIIQPSRTGPQEAVCRGAALTGALNLSTAGLPENQRPKVVGRIARRSYGVVAYELYDPKIHSHKDRVFHNTEQDYVFYFKFDPVVRGEKGDDSYAPEDDGPLDLPFQVEEALYASDCPNPPSMLDLKGGKMDQIGALRISTKVPIPDLPKERNEVDGEKVPVYAYYWCIEVTGDSIVAYNLRGEKIGEFVIETEPAR